MRRSKALILLVLLLFLTGCWDRVEVNDLAMVDLVAVDRAEAGLRLTISVIVPSRAAANAMGGGGGGGGAGGERPSVAYSAEGESIMNAMSKIQERVSRRLFWAHARVLIFGEEYARQGVRPAVDFWSRHREPRLRMQVAVTPGKAADFIVGKPRLERLLSETIRETLNMNLQASVTLQTFLCGLRSETASPYAPRVLLTPEPGGKEPTVSGTAIFKDDRLIGWLNDSETRGLLWLRGEMHTGVATVDIPSGGTASMHMVRSRSFRTPDFSTGKVRIKVSVEVEDELLETSAPLDLNKVETISVMEKLLAKDVRDRMYAALQQIQGTFGVDVLGFDDVINRRAPRRWEAGLKQHWHELFPQLPVIIDVKAHVRRTGEHGAPLGVPLKRTKSKPSQLLQQGG